MRASRACTALLPVVKFCWPVPVAQAVQESMDDHLWPHIPALNCLHDAPTLFLRAGAHRSNLSTTTINLRI